MSARRSASTAQPVSVCARLDDAPEASWNSRRWMSLGAVGHAFAHEHHDFVPGKMLDRPVDSKPAPGGKLDRDDADIAPHSDAAQHGVFWGWRRQRPPDDTRRPSSLCTNPGSPHHTDIHRCASPPAADTATSRCCATKGRAPGRIRDETIAQCRRAISRSPVRSCIPISPA